MSVICIPRRGEAGGSGGLLLYALEGKIISEKFSDLRSGAEAYSLLILEGGLDRRARTIECNEIELSRIKIV